MGALKRCFEAILHDDRLKSRLAARQVRKLLYGSACDKGKYEDIASIIDGAPDVYTNIIEDWRQENYVAAISVIYYLHSKDAQPDFLFPWLFYLLQHTNGVIRYAAVRMLTNEIGPLTVHIRFPNYKHGQSGKLNPKQASRILIFLFASLNELSSILWQPKYKRRKYIDSLPASPYKSVQMVLAQLEESCQQVK